RACRHHPAPARPVRGLSRSCAWVHGDGSTEGDRMRRRLATRLGHLLRSTTGGFNPANVTIGTVIGAIIMAASLFVVPGLITWAQDRDTRADLDKVRDAQRNALAVERVYLDEVALQDRG